MLFTNRALVYWLRVFEIPEMSRTSKGRALVNILNLREDERITAMIPIREFEEEYFVMMATARGRVKKTALSAFGKRGTGGIIALDLPENDRLVSVRHTAGEDEVVLVTAAGKAIRFRESDVRPMGRTARGVRGIRLAKGDAVVDIAIVRRDTTLLTVCENGYGKRTAFDEYSSHHRGGQGVINIQTTERNGGVVGAWEVGDEDEIMVLSEGGKMIRIPVKTISRIGRNTQGVRVVRLGEGDKVTGVARVVPEGKELEEQPAPKPRPKATAKPLAPDEEEDDEPFEIEEPKRPKDADKDAEQ